METMPITPDEYQSEAQKFDSNDAAGHIFEDFLSGHSSHTADELNVPKLLNAALGLSGEAGEVADLVKKSAFHGKELDTTHLKRELGDVLWYVAQACSAIGAELEDVMRLNLEKLSARYPDGGFDSLHANNRADGDI